MIEVLHCTGCDYDFGHVVEHKGKTALTIGQGDGTKVLIFRGLMVCPKCGSESKFCSEDILTAGAKLIQLER